MTPEAAVEWVTQTYKKIGRGLPWIFDWDGTLMRGDVGTQAAWGLLRSGLVSPDRVSSEWKPSVLRDMNFPDFERMRHEQAIKIGHQEIFEMETTLMAGFPCDVARKIVEEILELALSMGNIRRLEPMGTLLRQNVANAFVVSGSPKLSVTTVARHYGLAAERVYATELNVVDGVFGESHGPHGIVWAEQKRKVLEMENVKEAYFVAGDSTGDWDMMQLSKGVVWGVLWPRKGNPWATLREQLETSIDESLLPLPTHAGIYFAENPDNVGPRYWVVEIHETHQAI
ncbi:MAG: HAD family hydrolase [Bdellovibrionota bacterium]